MRPGQLGAGYTGDDGIGMYQPLSYIIEDCIIDFSGLSLDEQDEAVGVTWGASATFRRCVIKGAGKLILCGSGDKDKVNVEAQKRVMFYDCVFEDFGRRGPEVQNGMHATLHNCLIKNWGMPGRFTVRNFGSWAHRKGRIDAIGCVYWQDSFLRPLRQFCADLADHIGQAWNDEGIRGLLRLSAWIPGVCKGLYATDGGEAHAWQCWKNRWWIMLPWRHTTAMMDKKDALCMKRYLENMAAELEAELPQEGTNAA